MTSPFRSLARAAAALAFAALGPSIAAAQIGFESAKGAFAVFAPSSPLLVNIDFSQDAASLTGKRVLGQPAPVIGSQWDAYGSLGMSASKGKRTLLGSGTGLSSGWDGALGLAWSRVTASGCDSAGNCSGTLDRRVFAAASYKDASVDLADVQPQATTFATSASMTRTYNVGTSITWNVRRAVGFTASRISEFQSVEGMKARQVCTVLKSGLNAQGQTVTASSCGDRYTGSLWTGLSSAARVDFRQVPKGSPFSDRMSLGWAASASGKRRDGVDTTLYSAWVGPVITPADKPDQALFALLYGADGVKKLAIRDFIDTAVLSVRVSVAIMK